MKKPTTTGENEFFSMVSLLVVEDEDDILTPLQFALKRKFKTVYTARDGNEGCQKYEEYKPDIILTDISMPNKNGLEMAKELREKYGYGVPIIVVSAFNDEEYLIESIELGITRYVKKPIDLKVLESILFDIASSIYQTKKVEELDLTVHDLLDLLNDMILLTDGVVIKYANRAFLRFVRFHSFEEFSDEFYLINDMDTIIVKIQEKILKDSESWFEVMQGLRVKNFVTYLHSINDNSPTAFVTKITELPRNRGNYIVSFSDITKLEEDIFKLKEEAQNSIKLQILINEEIAKSREKEQLLIQQSKMAAMGEMMSAIVHQWKQPLNSIYIISQQLEDMASYKIMDEEKLVHISDSINSQIEFMNTTLDDFRGFIKPSKNMNDFNIKSAIEDICALIAPQLMSKNIELEILADENDCIVCGYKNEFKQVILNLLSNARDAILSHEQSEETKEIKVSIDECQRGVRIDIEDSGGGIKEEHISFVFDPYFSSKGEHGTGIGLYMSKTIIEQNMNGKISCKNGKRGAIFTIELPKSQEQK